MSTKTNLYVSASEIRAALSDLGNPTTRAESVVFTVASVMADMLDASDDSPKVWEINVSGPPEAVRQAGRPQAVIVCTDAEVDWDGETA